MLLGSSATGLFFTPNRRPPRCSSSHRVRLSIWCSPISSCRETGRRGASAAGQEEYPDTAVLLTSGYAKAADPLEAGFRSCASPISYRPWLAPSARTRYGTGSALGPELDHAVE